MIKAILFDIDNTLILFDEVKFFNAYIPKITPAFKELFSAEEFVKRLVNALQKMQLNSGNMSNADYYMSYFCKGMEERKQEAWDCFISFYETEFESLRSMTNPVKAALAVIPFLLDKGITIVAASHPIWPKMIQEKRLEWAGLDPNHFEHITHIENTTACKPQPDYYLDICKTIRVTPEECLMVGNDPVNDMVAGVTGMKTYLTTDAAELGFSAYAVSNELISNLNISIPKPDYSGTLADVEKVVLHSL